MGGAAIMFLLLGGLVWAASRAYAEDTPAAGPRRDPRTGLAVCDLPAAQIAERSGPQLRQWLNCPGRLNTEVQVLANILYAIDPSTAGAVLDRWRARRNIDTASPDGTLNPANRREVDSAMRASPGELRGPAYSPAPLAGVERDAQGDRLSTPRRESRARIETVESLAPATLAYDPNMARRLAGPLARHVETAGTGYDRARVRAFQRVAGFHANNQHGMFDCKTVNALLHFGISRAPSPIHGVTTNCSMHPYVAPRRG